MRAINGGFHLGRVTLFFSVLGGKGAPLYTTCNISLYLHADQTILHTIIIETCVLNVIY